MTKSGVITADVRARRANWRAIVIAALSGGAAFLLVDIVARSLLDPKRTWETPRHIAGLLIGERAFSEDASVGGLVTLALVLHAMLSLVYGMLLELAVRRLAILQAVAAGVVFASAVYAVNYYVMTGLFTSFAALRGTIAFSAHVAFGITAVVVHAALTHHAQAAPRAAQTS